MWIEKLNKMKQRNEWLYIRPVKVYVRKTRRFIHGQLRPTLEIANVVVLEKFQRKGHFKALLDEFESYAATHYRIMFIESVLNENLVNFFIRRGYHRIDASFYKPEPS